MKIGEKRHKKLYDAFAEPILQLRVKHAQGKVKDLDEELFVLTNRIHKEIKEALNLSANL